MLASLALVDLSYIVRLHFHARAKEGTPNDAVDAVMRDLAGYRQKFGRVILCGDAPPYERSKLFPAYKAHRSDPPPELQFIRKGVAARIAQDGYNVARSEGCEADDVIATLAARNDLATVVTIVGADKDTASCVRDGVQMHLPSGRTLTGQDVFEKFGVMPCYMTLYLALCGDSSDGIPGLPNWGPKTSARTINEFEGDVMRMAVHAVEQAGSKGPKCPMIWQSFLKHWPDDIKLWIKLATMRTDVPLDVESLLEERPMGPLVQEEELPFIEESQPAEPVEELISKPPTVFKVPPPAFVPTSRDAETNERAMRQPDPRKGEEIESIVVARPDAPSWALTLQPATANEALQIAKVLFNSRYFSQFGSERGLYAIIMQGRELGLGLMASLNAFHIVKDRPYPKATTLKALAERNPNCEWLMVTDADAGSCTIKTKHKKAGELVYTYTIQRARDAGYLNGGNARNWTSQPQNMLEARATSHAVRRWYPASILGLLSAEEASDE